MIQGRPGELNRTNISSSWCTHLDSTCILDTARIRVPAAIRAGRAINPRAGGAEGLLDRLVLFVRLEFAVHVWMLLVATRGVEGGGARFAGGGPLHDRFGTGLGARTSDFLHLGISVLVS